MIVAGLRLSVGKILTVGLDVGVKDFVLFDFDDRVCEGAVGFLPGLHIGVGLSFPGLKGLGFRV